MFFAATVLVALWLSASSRRRVQLIEWIRQKYFASSSTWFRSVGEGSVVDLSILPDLHLYQWMLPLASRKSVVFAAPASVVTLSLVS
jgi:hypothetical protein